MTFLPQPMKKSSLILRIVLPQLMKKLAHVMKNVPNPMKFQPHLMKKIPLPMILLPCSKLGEEVFLLGGSEISWVEGIFS